MFAVPSMEGRLHTAAAVGALSTWSATWLSNCLVLCISRRPLHQLGSVHTAATCSATLMQLQAMPE